jgi:hypothetical protein
MNTQSFKIDFTILADGYVLTFDAQKQKLIFVDPDVVLSKSVEDNNLPQDFINKLGDQLDNEIDVNSGNFSN